MEKLNKPTDKDINEQITLLRNYIVEAPAPQSEHQKQRTRLDIIVGTFRKEREQLQQKVANLQEQNEVRQQKIDLLEQKLESLTN